MYHFYNRHYIRVSGRRVDTVQLKYRLSVLSLCCYCLTVSEVTLVLSVAVQYYSTVGYPEAGFTGCAEPGVINPTCPPQY